MEQLGKKKEWVRPELLVLVRSHPEETVLAACKSGALSGPVNTGNCSPFAVDCDQIAAS